MGESTLGTFKLYRVTISRPNNDPSVPKDQMTLIADSDLFLFVKRDGQPSSDTEARQALEKIRGLLPQDWRLKITEVPFKVTYGAPAIVGTCPRATCEGYGKPINGRFFCSVCGEPLQLIWGGTLE